MRGRTPAAKPSAAATTRKETVHENDWLLRRCGDARRHGPGRASARRGGRVLPPRGLERERRRGPEPEPVELQGLLDQPESLHAGRERGRALTEVGPRGRL